MTTGIAVRASWWTARIRGLAMLAAAAVVSPAAAVDLADRPLFTSLSVPGNVVLSLSVEWPTANSPAYPSTMPYSSATAFFGYFDPQKCYRYVYDAATPQNSYFTPNSLTSTRTCSSTAGVPLWSGNYLNWASTHTLDAFRAVLTGGNRTVDTASDTIVQKTRHSGQGDTVTTWPDKLLSDGVGGATPFNWSSVQAQVFNLGVTMLVLPGGMTATAGNTVDYVDQGGSGRAAYRLYMRLRVCDATVGLEDNCVAYAGGYKPEGLLQQYADKLRYSVFGYLNDPDTRRDGGVMRARMKFIAPRAPVIGAPSVPNAAAEWDASTGVMNANPDAQDAASTSSRLGLAASDVANSGILNYINKFGIAGGDYKEFDPVGELFYAGLRYIKHQGPVASYADMSGASSTSFLSRASSKPTG